MRTAQKIAKAAKADASAAHHPPIDDAEHREAENPNTRIVPDRRGCRRVDIRLLDRFMRENRQEYPCQVINISPGDVAMLAPIAGEIGEHIVVYLDQIGPREGEVTAGVGR